MGNILTTDAEMKETVKMAVSEDKALIDKILKKSKELYEKNKEQFLDPEFCERIAITYSRKLYQLPIEKVKTIHDKIEAQNHQNLELTISYDPLKEEKFIVNELSGRLVDHFKNKKIPSSVEHKGIRLTFPDISYIHNRALVLLDSMQKKEEEKKQVGGHPLFLDEAEGGKRRRRRFRNINEEENNENENNENNNDNNEDYNYNNNDNNNENNNNEEDNEENFEKIRNNRRNNRRKNKKEKRRDNRRDNNFKSVFENKKEEIEYTDPLFKNIKLQLEEIKNNKKIEEKNLVKRKNNEENNTKPPENKKANNNAKPETKNNKNAQKNMLEMPSFNRPPPALKPERNNRPVPQPTLKPERNKPVQKPVLKPERNRPVQKPEQFVSREDLRKFKNIEASGDKYCLDEKQPCKLTKKEMCDKIIYHFIVRNNLIAAISSVVPIPNQAGDYYGGFVFQRIKSLEKGSFCLPPYYSDIQESDENIRIQKILKYLNILEDKECMAQGGYLLRLSETRMKELLQNDKLGRKYFDFGRKINLFYQEALINLYDILDKLQSNASLSTSGLNELSLNAKHIIDDLFIKTQFNYLLAVLVVLDFDFIKNQKELESKQKRMDKIIKEDFSNQ